MPQVPRPHPIKGILADRRITIRTLSPRVQVNAGTLGRVFNGYLAPWPALRRRCSEELGLPEAELFREPADGIAVDAEVSA